MNGKNGFTDKTSGDKAMKRRTLVQCMMLAPALLAAPTWAQDFPNRPVKLVVPFAAGGPADIQARWLAVKLSPILGQQVVIENKGGAGGILGAQTVATSAPDGYTLLFASTGAIAVAPYLSDKLGYDPKKDLVPVVRVGTAPTVLVTSANSPFHSLAEMIAAARSSPGKVTFASAGPGTSLHLGAELLAREAGVKLTHVPYRGAAPALADVIAGTVDVVFADAPVVLPFLQSGKMRALTIGTPQRIPGLPDVPTTAEGGYRNALVSTWYGMLAPGKTPAAVVGKINAAVNQVLQSAEAKTYFTAQSLQINGGTPQQFGEFIDTESTRWTALAKAIGVKME
jgi:tripartite-type tricarboxylate transporter receptor subunit TctC